VSEARTSAAPATFEPLKRRLSAYLCALFDMRPTLRGIPADVEGGARRTGFDDGLIMIPESFAGFAGEQGRRLFLASVAHIGAHMRSTRRLDRRGLKPIQMVLASLIEDARVEHLAISEFPGLARLWRPFHVARPGGTRIAPTMMASLARALIDESWEPSDAWVRKGRDMFFASRAEWSDPGLSRRIGDRLANDLGQMRVQFNAKTYVVEPAYRDDNRGIWSQEDDTDPAIGDDFVEQMRTERIDEPPLRQDDRNDAETQAEGSSLRLTAADEDSGVPVARYVEWDHTLGALRRDWTTVAEYEPRPASTRGIERTYEEYADVLDRIARLVRSAKVARPARFRHQAIGERLDLNAAIDAMIQRRAGLMPDVRVYERSVFRGRDLSVLVLLDISESTRDFVEGTSTTVLNLERTATALLAEAMEGARDPFAIEAFCSNGRSNVRYYRIKGFGETFGAQQKGRLAGLRSGYSTRMGAAIRHAGTQLSAQATHRRLLLVVTDGEPSDVDVPDEVYLVEDARRAVQSLATSGIDVFCVALDGGGDEYLTRIFGRRNVIQIDRVGVLPEKLPMLYLRLTR
jgi:hypothetical protein